jgi:nitronate monooxygenase
MDPDHLPQSDPSKMDFGGEKTKAWKDIWGCGQGIGAVQKIQSTADLVAQFKREFAEAKNQLLTA